MFYKVIISKQLKKPDALASSMALQQANKKFLKINDTYYTSQEKFCRERPILS